MQILIHGVMRVARWLQRKKPRMCRSKKEQTVVQRKNEFNKVWLLVKVKEN
jgi:hypothetical protein